MAIAAPSRAPRGDGKGHMGLVNQIFGVLLIGLALLMAVSLISHSPEDPPNSSNPPELVQNLAGWIGGQISYYLMFVVGYGSYVLTLIVLLWGWNRFRQAPVSRLAWNSLTMLSVMCIYCGVTGVPSRGRTHLAFKLGGWLGVTLSSAVLVPYLGRIGSYIILATALLVVLMLATNIPFSRLPDLALAGCRWCLGAMAAVWATAVRTGSGLRARLKRRRPGSTEPDETVEDETVEEEKAFPVSYSGPLADQVPGSGDDEAGETEAGVETEPDEIESEEGEPEAGPQDEAGEPDPGLTPELDPGPVSGPEEDSGIESDEEEPPPPRDVAIVTPPKELLKKVRKGKAPKVESIAGATYLLPPLNLLDEPPEREEALDKTFLMEGAQTLEQSLASFGIEGKVVQVNPGPVITGYEVQPPRGVKVNRIVNLSDDLALVMKARSIRIQAPIPGKAAVGVEVPNPKPEVVSIKEILQSKAFNDTDGKLMLAFGKTAPGEPCCGELTGMPHLLIAGATGSGKSVCINALIASILVRCRPEEVRFIMVDPKMLELSIYDNIPHLLTPVVTEPKKASEVLRWAVLEMETRYRTMAEYSVRNILDFNKKLDRMREEAESEEDRAEILEALPYLVIVIDELADLMMTAPADIEDSLARLAQMARAVGIHLILATQRPSVNVITGTIKANFPSRIAFRVASKVDSRTILDANGAEKLLGRGDMLFLPAGRSEPVRIHGAWISTDETERLVDWVCSQGVKLDRLDLGGDDGDFSLMEETRDDRFDEAMKLVIQHQQGSASLLQRRMKVGYARAARLIDQLEQASIVAASDGSSKAREVLVPQDYLERLEELDEYDTI
jgi:DNA segregation ATPase FtsK/SpoIIIE, S-DNA-T family